MREAVRAPVVNEEAFVRATGVSFKELSRQLKQYAERGKYRFFRLDKPELAQDERIVMKDVPEPEADLILGPILLGTRGPSDAYPSITRAYTALEASPQAATNKGLLFLRREDYRESVKEFKKAIAHGSESPFPTY